MDMAQPTIEPTPGALAAVRISPIAVVADRLGATASLLCAVHCALLPFVLALLPLIGLGFLADHRFERVFVACAAALASVTIVTAWRRHRRLHALFLLVPGIALLLAGIVIDISRHEWLHTGLVVCGGVLVASAHIVNLVLSHRHVHSTDCVHARAG
ncbi:MAG TPA: MerC domain-containing protein [Rhodanobacteraceae bacterium]|nr:MerC domain-containing protein [Rhodanobacteraceae bacterium]